VNGDIYLEGRRALVTGAGRGIGKAVALALAGAGADVVVNDVNQETGARTSREIELLGHRSAFVAADLSRPSEVGRMCVEAEAALGSIDILVNNAGISLYRAIADCTEEDWDLHLNIMAKATFLTMRHFGPRMAASGWGRIVNLGSYVAQLNCVTKYFGPYCAAKFAVVGLTQVAAQEFAPHVTVNAVGPGDVATEMMEQEWVDEGDRRQIPASDVKEEYRKRLILARFEEPADIAKAILFLCGPLGGQVTASHLIVSGGLPFKVSADPV
jgi:NAD(P)-dependent dehydrogenase (short-subunit alcohol dehydrogenase family)